MLKPNERRDLKKTYKRIAIFLVCVFIIDAFICFLFYKYTKMNDVLCGFLIICITSILYLPFYFICAKIDKKRREKLERAGNKDPFSHS